MSKRIKMRETLSPSARRHFKLIVARQQQHSAILSSTMQAAVLAIRVAFLSIPHSAVMRFTYVTHTHTHTCTLYLWR